MWQVGPDGADKDEIEKLAGAMAKVGLSQCMQAKWLKIDKAQGGKIFRETESVTDTVQEQLQGVRKGHFPAKADLDKLKKRKLVLSANYKTFKVTKGAEFSETRTKAQADITADMMHDGSWKTAKFKPYNFKALGQVWCHTHFEPPPWLLFKPRCSPEHAYIRVCMIACPLGGSE